MIFFARNNRTKGVHPAGPKGNEGEVGIPLTVNLDYFSAQRETDQQTNKPTNQQANKPTSQ